MTYDVFSGTLNKPYSVSLNLVFIIHMIVSFMVINSIVHYTSINYQTIG